MSDPTGALLIDRARSLSVLLADQAAEAERLRRPTDEVIRALEDADLFRLMVPRCHGGLEMDLDVFVEVVLALGEGDASMSWVAAFYIEHNWMFCQFPEAFQRALFANRSYVLAPGAIAPNGLAKPVDGGLLLNGRWAWGTGAMHASWVLVGARIEGSSALDFRFLALPIDQVTIEDTWFVDGMVGTGSNDLVIDNVVVPLERTVSIVDMTHGTAHGASLHEGPLYRTPMVPILALTAAMPGLAQARVAVRRFRERIESRVLYGAGKQSEKPAAQMRLARVDIAVNQAELLLRQIADEVQTLRNKATLVDRARWAASIATVVQQSKSIVNNIAEASGASAHFSKDPLQRAVRDLNTLSCHVVFDLDARLEVHGRALLGLEPGGMV